MRAGQRRQAERTDAADRAGILVLRIIQSPLPARQLIRAFDGGGRMQPEVVCDNPDGTVSVFIRERHQQSADGRVELVRYAIRKGWLVNDETVG